MSMIFKCDLCKKLIKPDDSRMAINISRPGYALKDLGSFCNTWDICNTCANILIERLDISSEEIEELADKFERINIMTLDEIKAGIENGVIKVGDSNENP